MSCLGRCWLPPRGRSAPPPLLLLLLLCPPPPPRPPPPSSSSSSAAAEPCTGHRRQQRRRGRSLTRGAPCPCRGGGRGRSPRRSRSSTVSPCWGRHQRAGCGAVTAGGGHRLSFPPRAQRPTGPRRRRRNGPGPPARPASRAAPPARCGQRQVRPAWAPAGLASAGGSSRDGAAAGTCTHTDTHTRGARCPLARRGCSGEPDRRCRKASGRAWERPPCPRSLRAPAGEGEERLQREAGRAGWRSGGALLCPPAAPPLRSPPLQLQQTPGCPTSAPGAAPGCPPGPLVPLGSFPGRRLPTRTVCCESVFSEYVDIRRSRTRRTKTSDIFGSQVIQENPVYLILSLKVTFFTRGLTKLKILSQ